MHPARHQLDQHTPHPSITDPNQSPITARTDLRCPTPPPHRAPTPPAIAASLTARTRGERTWRSGGSREHSRTEIGDDRP